MNSKLEMLENNIAKLTIEVDQAKFEEGMKYSFNKNKNNFNISGFRKGKVNRVVLERMYGEQVLYEDAVNFVIPSEYAEAVKEHKLEVVSRPEVDIVQIGKGKNFIFTAKVTLKPEIELGEYKGLEVPKTSNRVTAKEIDEVLNKEAEKNVQLISIEDRAVKDGDVVNINYEGSVDGEVFEGGKAENYDLTIGSKTFIDNFEEQLIGKNIGDEFDITVKFPKKYHSEQLAGKEAVFKVKINEITEKVLPEINDEFAKDVSEFDTLDEYKKEIKKNIKDKKNEEAKIKKENEAIKKAIENSKMDIPNVMIENQIDKLVYNFDMRMRQSGLTLEQYVKFSGKTIEDMREELKDEAKAQVESALLLDAIVKTENIEVSDEEYQEKLKEIASKMNLDMEKVTQGLVGERKEEFINEIRLQKAVDLIVESSVEAK